MSDISGLKAKLKADVISAVQGEVAEAAKKAMREAINSTMYASGGGAYYDRTGDFLQAIAIEDQKSSGTTSSFKVIVRGSMLTPSFVGDGWNQHMDVNGNAWNGDGIVEVLDEGTKSRSLYMHKGYRFYEKAHKDMDVELIRVLARSLSSRGWDVQIV
ncbi:hypothetical protein [Vagococcus fluvialis]|uniref:hypothetical protein n=1 Tax=Vagococcus fluvialis TaxID=2738 RepID=UPI001D0B9A36|nr:hypothetical protein [Vagococcus fluvialis]UDM72730.1 hypothetical protein K5L00_14320 [Vagococcus fluvialis]UDM78452.1 hypothetical protein K5K98_14525 [Vagococcus fluvialis]UDM84005.1 hypothetical protein K5K96_14345 [Vagococcus fluvialis]